MSLISIAWKSIRQRMLASSLTGLSVALGVALMIAVLVFNGVLGNTFSQNSVGYDLIVGAKGSEWQLVFNTIFRVDKPINDMPWSFYKTLSRRREVGKAIPFAVSDTTEKGNFPIVATIPQFFDVPYAYDSDTGKPLRFRIPKEGHSFLQGTWDAVIGAEVARKNQWGVGATFKLLHSGAGIEAHVHDEEFTVRGVLAPTGTANDRTVFIHIDGFFLLDEHGGTIDELIKREMLWTGKDEATIRKIYADEIAQMEKEAAEHAQGGHHHHHHAPSDLKKGVSAVLLVMSGNPKRPKMHQLTKDAQAMKLAAELREESHGAQAVRPVGVLNDIKKTLIGNIHLGLLALTVLIIAVSGISIFVSIYNSMSERRKEIAIMRALGAQRSTVFSVILLESMLLCVGGGILGLLLGHGLVMAAAPIIEKQSGLLIDPFRFEMVELWLIPAMILMATLVGFLPGLTAYRTDVADALQD